MQWTRNENKLQRIEKKNDSFAVQNAKTYYFQLCDDSKCI